MTRTTEAVAGNCTTPQLRRPEVHTGSHGGKLGCGPQERTAVLALLWRLPAARAQGPAPSSPALQVSLTCFHPAVPLPDPISASSSFRFKGPWDSTGCPRSSRRISRRLLRKPVPLCHVMGHGPRPQGPGRGPLCLWEALIPPERQGCMANKRQRVDSHTSRTTELLSQTATSPGSPGRPCTQNPDSSQLRAAVISAAERFPRKLPH